MEKIIRFIDQILNFLILSCFLIIALYGMYGIWDNSHINQQGDATQYKTYKPSSEDNLSFEDLVDLNKEVIGWLVVNKTNIDYPVLQSDNNSKYVNTDVYGKFSLAGSIFLDYKNNKNFSDMNNILYGHHMEKDMMFGEIDSFAQKDYFDKHTKGKLFYDNQWHKIEFFAFLCMDAYDDIIYNTFLNWEQDGDTYLNYIKENAINYREISAEKKRFLTLSTCNSDSTNGRYILIGYIKDGYGTGGKDSKCVQQK